MMILNNQWVDEQIGAIASFVDSFRNGTEDFHFEPTTRFYEALGSEAEQGLQHAASRIALHLELPVVPDVDFDWGIKMEPQIAGQVRLDHPEAPIRIPFQYAGRAYALGAILAHEMCHVFMAVRRIRAGCDEDQEPLTDLITACTGLGKLSLNGTLPEPDLNLGYLSHDMLAYAFRQVNKLKGIHKKSARMNLRPEIQI